MYRARILSISAMLLRLGAATRGGVAVIGALSLTTTIGMGAFAVEATQGYAAKVGNQRVADMAALAGALAYNVSNSSSQMTATAKAVAVAQGLPANSAAVALTTDSGTGQQLVQVTVTTSVGRVFTSALSYDVSAVGAATTTKTSTVTPPCIAAISNAATDGISMNGNTAIIATGCSVDTNDSIGMVGSASITAKQVDAGQSISRGGGASITTSPSANNIFANKANATSDWMQNDAGLKALLCSVNKLTGYSDGDYADSNTACLSPLVAPSPAGASDWALNYSPNATVAAYRTGNATYVIPSGTYAIRNLTLAGGITATFQGPVNLTIGSITLGGGTTLHVGSGNISVNGKIDLSGGAYADFAVGVGNSVTVGNDGASPPVAISVGGGSTLCFTSACAAPTAAGGTFSANGKITSNGGSTIIFPKAATHVINGNLDLSGSSTFGSGTYVIAGNFTNNTGGTMSGTDVSFALGGTFALSGGTSLDLAAPGGSSSYGVPGVLFATKSSSASSIGGGSSDKYAGLVYAPKSDLSISGGSSVSASGAACLMMIIRTITLSGSGSTSTGTCSALPTTTGSTANVALFR